MFVDLRRWWSSVIYGREMAGQRSEPHGNLPPGGGNLSSFVGRRDLLATARRRLADKRLVTLTGVGGTGKTRLALELGDQVRDEFPGGVYLVELGTFTDDDESHHSEVVQREIAYALGVRQMSQVDPFDAIIEHIKSLGRDGELLLILDNAEQLGVAVASTAATLLSGAPSLRILTTSREQLHVNGEEIIPVPPLAVPDSDELPVQADSESVALLVDRVRAGGKNWEITDKEWPAVVAILTACGGIPLAIELAAGRLKSFGVEIIAQRIDNIFDLLTSRTRMVLPHHQTLLKVVEWSYNLCTAGEQVLWARLAVFSGGCTLHAAEEVCGDSQVPHEEIADGLEGLVAKSIVFTSADGTRYELHAPLRQFGHDKLAKSGDEQAIRRRHRDWAAAMIARAAVSWLGPDELDVLRRVWLEVPNLRAAMAWSVRVEPDTEIGLLMAVDLLRTRAPFFYGLLPESRDLLRTMLEATTVPPSPLRASAVALGAWITLCQGDKQGAGVVLRQAMDIAAAVQAPSLPAVLFATGSYRMLTLGEPDSVRQLIDARDAFLAAGSPEDANMAHIIGAIGAALLAPTEDVAVGTAEELLHHNRVAGAQWAISWSEMAMAMGCLRWRQPDKAERLLLRSLRDMQTMGDRWGTLWCVEAHAWLRSYRVEAGKPVDSGAVARQAAVLLGAAYRLQEFTDVIITGLAPFHDARRAAIARVKKVLPPDEFDRHYQEGREIESYDDAIALALQDVEEPPDDSLSVPFQLTDKQWQVAVLVAQGLRNDEVAGKLFLSKRTVDSHLRAIYDRLGFNNRVALVQWVARQHTQHQVPAP